MQLFRKQKFLAQLEHIVPLAQHIILPVLWVIIIMIKVRVLVHHAQHVLQIIIVLLEVLHLSQSFLAVMDSYVTVLL
jgi:hypothetical protein